MTLSPQDRALIEGLSFDPAATAAYNEITGALAWSDEIPEELSQPGRDFLRDLLAVRGYLHRGLPIDTVAGADAWTEALASELRWNGFRRVTLTADQRSLLERHMRDDSEL